MAQDSTSRGSRPPGSRTGSRRDTSRVVEHSSNKPTDKVDNRSGKPDTTRVVKAAVERKWRVAVVAPALDFNGISLYAVTLVKALAGRGDEVLLISQSGPLLSALAGVPFQHYELPRSGLGFFGWGNLKTAVQAFAPEVLHAMSPQRQLPAVRLADTLVRPLCVTVHGVKAEDLPRVEDTSFDGYIATDAAVRERLVNDCRLSRSLVTQINLAVQPVRPPQESHVMDQKATPAVGMVGPLEPGVGFEAFIEAVNRICAKSSRPIFSVLGDGPRRSEIRKMAEDRGLLQRVVMLDKLYDYSLAWRPFDVVFVDTRQPASGMIVLGAMAYGLPVVATEGGAVFDIIEDGIDGLLVQRDDPEQLAQRLLMLIENHGERLRMGRAAFARVENAFSPERLVSAMHETYAALEIGDALPRQGEGSPASKRPTRSLT